MRKILLLTTFLGVALAYGAGCGDGGSGSGGGGGSTNTGGTTSSGGTTASGGSTGGATSTGGSTGGSTSTGGTGGTTTSATLVNGCDPAAAEDHTADALTTVTQSGFAYAPKCIKIKAGSSVKFVSNFMLHPLVGGVVENGAKVPDANSPITMTSTGMEATFAFPAAGDYGYYCNIHALSGMTGAVFVE